MRLHPAHTELCQLALSAALLIAALAFSVPASAEGMVSLERAVKNCRLIPDAASRLNCYDGVIDEAAGIRASAPPPAKSVVSSAPVVRSQPAGPPTVANAAPPAPSPAAAAQPAQLPAAAPVLQASQAASTQAEKPGKGIFGFLSGDGTDAKISVQIASADRLPNQQLRLVTSDGTSWDQIDSTELSRVPAAGEEMLVRKNAFGRYSCKLDRLDLFYCRPKS